MNNDIKSLVERGDASALASIIPKKMNSRTKEIWDESQTGLTALMWAVVFGQREVVRRLVDAGADVNLVTKAVAGSGERNTALDLCVYLGDHTGANTIADSITAKYDLPVHSGALWKCLFKGWDDVASILLRCGYDVNRNDGSGGETSLIMSISENHESSFYWLIRQGADIEVSHRTVGITPLHVAIVNRRENMVRMLIEAGAKVIDESNRFGNTILHSAVISGDRGIVEVVLELVDSDLLRRFLEMKNKDGMTPYAISIQRLDRDAKYAEIGGLLKRLADGMV